MSAGMGGVFSLQGTVRFVQDLELMKLYTHNSRQGNILELTEHPGSKIKAWFWQGSLWIHCHR